MYAAAGGASLASRRADKKKALQQRKKADQQQLLRDKNAQAKAAGNLETPTKSKGFHQLPASYLRPPQGQGRKLSATYTGTQGSRLLLPINEASFNDELKSPTHGGGHFLVLGPNVLHKSASSTIPLVNQVHWDGSTPPATPNICYPKDRPFNIEYTSSLVEQKSHLHLPLPYDPIIITPATPSPGHHNLVNIPLPGAPMILERKCSIYRGKKLDPTEETFYRTTNYQTAQELYNEEFRAYFEAHQSMILPNGGYNPWCLVPEHHQQGVCTCELEVGGINNSNKIFSINVFFFLSKIG